MLTRADRLTVSARDMNYAVMSPVVLNLEIMERLFSLSYNHLDTPVILRVDTKNYDVGDYAFFADYYAKRYPSAQVALMADDVSSYEMACLACRYRYNGVSLSNKICIDKEKNLDLIKKVARVCQASDCALEVCVSNPKNLLKPEVIDFILDNHISLIRILLKEEITDKNIKKWKKLLLTLRRSVPACICIDDMSNVDINFYEDFKWSGLSKFNVYNAASLKASKACKAAYDDDPDKNSRGILPNMRKSLYDTYMADLSVRIKKIGNFVNKHVVPTDLVK